MFQTAIKYVREFLKKNGVQTRLSGGSSDREQHLRFRIRKAYFDMYMEFPGLPILTVFESPKLESQLKRIYSADDTPELKEVSKQYYGLIAQLSIHKLDAERDWTRFDQYLIPVVEYFCQVIQDEMI